LDARTKPALLSKPVAPVQVPPVLPRSARCFPTSCDAGHGSAKLPRQVRHATPASALWTNTLRHAIAMTTPHTSFGIHLEPKKTSSTGLSARALLPCALDPRTKPALLSKPVAPVKVPPVLPRPARCFPTSCDAGHGSAKLPRQVRHATPASALWTNTLRHAIAMTTPHTSFGIHLKPKKDKLNRTERSRARSMRLGCSNKTRAAE